MGLFPHIASLNDSEIQSVVRSDAWSPHVHWRTDTAIYDTQLLASDVGINDTEAMSRLGHLWLAEWTPATLIRRWIHGSHSRYSHK